MIPKLKGWARGAAWKLGLGRDRARLNFFESLGFCILENQCETAGEGEMPFEMSFDSGRMTWSKAGGVTVREAIDAAMAEARRLELEDAGTRCLDCKGSLTFDDVDPERQRCNVCLQERLNEMLKRQDAAEGKGGRG